ncbi:MAG: hypothetical protein KAG61_00445 [Bacteriovoracaceae bacterium]|nr:hypothetical protein [Bacteriovoracaceae bacterium]
MRWPKNHRQERIIQVLNKVNRPLSVTEVDNALFFQFEQQSSRRTVDRDLRFLKEVGLIAETIVKSKKCYSKSEDEKITLELTPAEYKQLMTFLETAISEELISLRTTLQGTEE